MSKSDIAWMSGIDTADAIRRRQLSPVEAVESVLERLEETEPHINAFVTVLADQAREHARRCADVLAHTSPSELPPLFGVPITVKDLSDTAGVRTTYGSRKFRDHVPEHDSINWARLKAAGAILIGKTTTPEFGGLGVTQSGLTGTTNNPWRTTHTSGGSSGGAAASVAAGVGALAWGSDGGGSIRVPASCCGVVGLKPSRGRVPVNNPWETVGTEGPLTRTVIDSALLLSVTAGPDPRDPLALPASMDDYVAAVLQATLKGKRIAFAPNPAGANVDAEVAAIVRRAVEQIGRDGQAPVDEVGLNLPDPVRYFEDFWSPGFATYDGQASPGAESDPELTAHKAMLDFATRGRAMSAVEHLQTATKTRGEITAAFNAVFENHDLIVMPTMPVTAFPHPGEAAAGNTHVNGIPVARPAIDFHRFTESPSHAGLPAISVPCGFSADGLPVGLQIIGPHYADLAVLAAAAAIEQILPWRNVRPPV
jgi:Asp-tRNA(Asn)/Glu-tRNA(Gln) amidotransferase A subunit family amidase